jgi:hypothetical protein
MSTPMRLIAKIVGVLPQPKVRHYRGMPPELTGHEDHRQEMARPSVLVIEEKKDGVFLFRFASDGHCVGDTWHRTIDEAKEQAGYEFENLVSAWGAVPTGIEDVVAFGLRGGS